MMSEQIDKLRERIAIALCKADGYDWEHINSWLVRLIGTVSRYKYYQMADGVLPLIEEVKTQERERILTDDLPLSVFNRMEMWWYEPENTEMIEDLCTGEFDEVSKLLRSFIVALRQALKEEK